MSGSLNRVELIGHLGRDPEARATGAGTVVSNLSVATSESWKDKSTGEKQERTEWHRVVLYGRIAEVANHYLSKGSQVFIAGKLQTRKWEDKQGNERYTTEVVGQELVMLGGGRRAQGDSPQSPGLPATSPPRGESGPYTPTQADKEFDDDIPFMWWLPLLPLLPLLVHLARPILPV